MVQHWINFGLQILSTIVVLASERQHKGSNTPSVNSPAADEEKIRAGYWLGSVMFPSML